RIGGLALQTTRGEAGICRTDLGFGQGGCAFVGKGEINGHAGLFQRHGNGDRYVPASASNVEETKTLESMGLGETEDGAGNGPGGIGNAIDAGEADQRAAMRGDIEVRRIHEFAGGESFLERQEFHACIIATSVTPPMQNSRNQGTGWGRPSAVRLSSA